MEMLVTEALRNTVDCRCSSETLEPIAAKITTVKWRNTTPTAPHCNYILIS